MKIWFKTGDASQELSPYLECDCVDVDEVLEGLRDHEDCGRPTLTPSRPGRLSYGDLWMTGTGCVGSKMIQVKSSALPWDDLVYDDPVDTTAGDDLIDNDPVGITVGNDAPGLWE